METLKICNVCGLVKDINKFPIAKTCKGGRDTRCIECETERGRQRYLKKAAAGNYAKQSTLVARELFQVGKARCPICKEVKDFETGFYPNKASRTGYAAHCIVCSNELSRKRPTEERHEAYIKYKRTGRNNKLVKNFGITIEQYEQMLADQNGECAICGGTDKKKSLAVDHDHETGKIRGLLCGRCNPSVGFLLNSVERAQKIIEYIKKFSDKGE